MSGHTRPVQGQPRHNRSIGRFIKIFHHLGAISKAAGRLSQLSIGMQALTGSPQVDYLTDMCMLIAQSGLSGFKKSLEKIEVCGRKLKSTGREEMGGDLVTCLLFCFCF